MTAPGPDGLTAILLQLSDHAERLGRVDEREAEHWRRVAGQLSDLGRRVGGLSDTLQDQAAALTGLEGLTEQLATLLERAGEPDEDGPEPGYEPAPTVRWWSLDGSERQAAIGHLRAWVGEIYVPGYGSLAAQLPACWTLHPLCLYTLDWLSELWSVLYLQDERTAGLLGSQAEWQTRVLPAAVEQMAAEARNCGHRAGSPRPAGGAR